MRGNVPLLLAFALAVGLGFLLGGSPAARAQDTTPEQAAPPPALPGVGVLDPDRIWNFHFDGKKRKGDFLELAALDAPEHRGRVLVLTHLVMSLPHGTRVEVVEFHRDGAEEGQEKAPWKKRVRRSEAFSAGWVDSTSKGVLTGQSSLVGLKFGPMTRPTLAITQGGGDIAVYAEGYWADLAGGGESQATRGPVSGGK